MPQDPSRPPSANPGGERGRFHSGSSSQSAGTRPPRPQSDAQRALNPGRAAHAASEARGSARGQREGMRRGLVGGLGAGTAVTALAATVKDQYDKTMSENAKFKSFNEGKVAGRQTNSSGGKTPKSTYQAPMTKALIADGAKPVMKPK